jgi:metal-sulfur cluster biosynthetic enzyme
MVVLEDERTALADEKVHGTMTVTIVGCPLPDLLSEDIDTTFAYARNQSRHALALKSL